MPIVAALPAIIGAAGSIGGSLLNKRAGDRRTSTAQGSEEQLQSMLRQFDPASMTAYQGLQPQVAEGLSEYMQNPWTAGYFQKMLGRSQEQIGQRGRTNMQGTLDLLGQSSGGVGNMPAYLMSQAGAVQRGTSREQSTALTDLLLGSNELRQKAIGQAASYRPLETGQTTTSTGTFDRTGSDQSKSGSIWGDLLSGLGGALSGLMDKTKKPTSPLLTKPIGIPPAGSPLGASGGQSYNFFRS